MEKPNENIQPNLNREQTNSQSPGIGNLGSQDVFHEKLHCRDLENESVDKNNRADLKWYFVTKIVPNNCSSDQEKLLKFEAEAQEFAKILRSHEQFIQTVKG